MRAAIAVALLLVLVVTGCSGDDGEPSATTVAPVLDPGDNLYGLEVGDCFSGLGQGQDLEVRVRPCEHPHEAEVYGTSALSARRFPGVDTLRRQAATTCAQLFAGYTGEPAGPDTRLGFVEVVPTLASWAAGDRAALCVAVGLDGVPLPASIAAGGVP